MFNTLFDLQIKGNPVKFKDLLYLDHLTMLINTHWFHVPCLVKWIPWQKKNRNTATDIYSACRLTILISRLWWPELFKACKVNNSHLGLRTTLCVVGHIESYSMPPPPPHAMGRSAFFAQLAILRPYTESFLNMIQEAKDRNHSLADNDDRALVYRYQVFFVCKLYMVTVTDHTLCTDSRLKAF